MTTSESHQRPLSRRARRGALAIALWLFSISTTVLLLGLWGRTVAADEEAIEAGTRAVLESDVVSGRITQWIARGLSESSNELSEGLLMEVASDVWNHAETRAVLDDAVSRLVGAALAPPGTSVPVDVSELLRPLTPVVVSELASRGITLSSAVVDAALGGLPTIVLGTEAEFGVVSAVAEARAALTRVVAVAVIGMTAGAVLAVALAEERIRQLRGLAVRVAVSALTFALLLRISSWALDPGRGRSPLATGGSIVLASGGHVLVIAAAIAAGIGLFATVGLRRRRRAVTV